MKAFVTGGSGFLGQRVVKMLVERGVDVFALARSPQSEAIVRNLGATAVKGNITDVESMRADMQGSDIVFHIAGWFDLGDLNWAEAEIVNVGGTRRVLKLAHELGVPKIVYTSTVAIYGDTGGEYVDESYYYAGPFSTEYERTKWLAHHKVALPLIRQGAPIVIVLPGAIFGPNDPSYLGELMRRFYTRRLPFPFLPGPTTILTFAYVDDVAEGHLLAAEKGKIGESYILAGPAIPLGEMVDFWARLTGKRSPTFHIPANIARLSAPLYRLLENYIDLPQPFLAGSIRSMGKSFMASADKAKQELGWQPRSLHVGMLDTFAHIAAEAAETPPSLASEKRVAKLALVSAAALLLLWLLSRKKRHE